MLVLRLHVLGEYFLCGIYFLCETTLVAVRPMSLPQGSKFASSVTLASDASQ